jgi:hypothetical protein
MLACFGKLRTGWCKCRAYVRLLNRRRLGRCKCRAFVGMLGQAADGLVEM